MQQKNSQDKSCMKHKLEFDKSNSEFHLMCYIIGMRNNNDRSNCSGA